MKIKISFTNGFPVFNESIVKEVSDEMSDAEITAFAKEVMKKEYSYYNMQVSRCYCDAKWEKVNED